MNDAILNVSERITALHPYQPGKPIDEVKRELGLVGEVVKLASNENPLGPCPAAMSALAKALPTLSLYPDGGCHDLRRALAKALSVPDDWLIFGNGSDEIIHLLGLTFLTEGDEVVVGDPTFVLYESAATLAGAATVKVPLTRPGFVHDVRAMADAFTGKTRLVFIANPHNPTGSVIDKADVKHLLERLPDRALLVLDEAYVEYVGDDPEFPYALDSIRGGAPVISLRTFSKIYGLAGLRVGYGVGTPEIIRLLNQARSPFNVNLAGQVAAAAALADRDWVRTSRDANRAGYCQLTAAFDQMGLPWARSWANFILVDIRRPCKATFDALLRRGVIVRAFPYLPTHLRVTIGTSEQNERFLAALGDVLHELPETA